MEKHRPDAELFAALIFLAKQNCSPETFENENAMHVIKVTIVVSPWALNITCDFRLHGHLPRIKIPYVCSYRSCYSDRPLEMGYMGAYPGGGAWVYNMHRKDEHNILDLATLPQEYSKLPYCATTTHFKS